jgi:hypothetical protein
MGGHSTSGSRVVELVAATVVEVTVVVASTSGVQAAATTATNIRPTRCIKPR